MDDLLAAIKKRAVSWASQITKLANVTPGKPAHIQVKSTVTENSGMIGINSTGYSEKGDARAYEYGSGIHATSKKRSKHQQADGTILIAPKTKKVLAFYWDKLAGDPPGTWYGGTKLIRKTADDVALFRYVNHPGVRAAGDGKGYLRPAISQTRKSIRKELTKDMRDAYIGTIRKVFKK